MPVLQRYGKIFFTTSADDSKCIAEKAKYEELKWKF
jgi:hypothetical protein